MASPRRFPAGDPQKKQRLKIDQLALWTVIIGLLAAVAGLGKEVVSALWPPTQTEQVAVVTDPAPTLAPDALTQTADSLLAISKAQTQQAVAATLQPQMAQPLVCTDPFGNDIDPCGVAINKKINGSDWTGETLRQDGTFTIKGTRMKPDGPVWQVFKLQEAPHLTDFYMKVDVKFNSSSPETTAGIAFRASDNTKDYYLFEFKNSGEYRAMLYRGGSGTDLIADQDFQPSEAFNPDGSNRIEVLASGSHFEIFVNGSPVQAYDDTEYSSGFAGLFVRFRAAGDTGMWQFDNLEVRAPSLPIPGMEDFESLKDYTKLYDFASAQDIDPVFTVEQPMNCTFDNERGVAWLTCDSTPDEVTFFRLWPRSKDPIRGIAMLAHVDAPYDENWARINPYLHFLQPNTSDQRQYGASLRKGMTGATQYYPKLPKFPATPMAALQIAPEQQGQFHLVQMQFVDGSLGFFFDGQPMKLDTQPNLPADFVLDRWLFEIYLNKEPANDAKTVSMQIAWFAVLK